MIGACGSDPASWNDVVFALYPKTFPIDLVDGRIAIDAAMNAESIPHAPDPRRERLARAMTTHSSRPWEDMNENTRKLHLAEADRLLAAIDGRDGDE